jgi:hypothetical protein
MALPPASRKSSEITSPANQSDFQKDFFNPALPLFMRSGDYCLSFESTGLILHAIFFKKKSCTKNSGQVQRNMTIIVATLGENYLR